MPSEPIAKPATAASVQDSSPGQPPPPSPASPSRPESTSGSAKNRSLKLICLGVALLLASGGAGAYWLFHRAPPPLYVTESATIGDVTTTISASGTINPVITVAVGTFVSGVIQTLACDYNTRVSKGQLCAKIDPAPYQAVVAEDQAGLTSAKAQMVKDQASLDYAKVSSDRASLLFKQDSGSHNAADAALAAYREAQAQVGLDAAQVGVKAAALSAGQINLNYTNIISPVNGTVVARNVTAGQTVAASFSTPTLFLIANDLTKMQVDTNVSESDIAGAMQGAGASFTVDAYPKGLFTGKVVQVRQAPISVQNVITYDVVIAVANPDLKLKPGMTATARINTAQAVNVLRVPSQALRFTPTDSAKGPRAKRGQGRVWVDRDGKLTAVPVTVGLTGESFAEIKSGSLKIGDPVVVSQAAAGAARAKSRAAATPALKL
jgi:HlyD family secretion protein